MNKRCCFNIIFWKGVVFFILVGLKSANAQDSLRTGVKYGFLPQLSYNSDFGVFMGGEVTRYDYKGLQPFRNLTFVRAVYKTNGAFALNIKREEVETFGTDLRTTFETYIVQDFNNFYFGDTEKLGFDQARFDSTEFYNFNSFGIDFGVNTRIPLRFEEGISRIDVKTGIKFIHESPLDNPEDSFINSTNIEGSNGATLTLLSAGLVVERRDSEFRAGRGYLIDIGFNVAPPLISTHTTMKNYMEMKAFIPIMKKIPTTLATRVDLRNTIGEVPYWFKPSLSGSGRMRGYMFRSNVSDNAFSYSVELRTWLFKIPFKNIELGGTAFVDGGRVFTNQNWVNMFSDHKVSLGLGGVMSIFTPDFILKYEMAFSDDGIGIVLGSGYSF